MTLTEAYDAILKLDQQKGRIGLNKFREEYRKNSNSEADDHTPSENMLPASPLHLRTSGVADFQ